MKSSGPSGLLGGGGADNKKAPNLKPSLRSRPGLLYGLRGADGEKVTCNSFEEAQKVAELLESCDTASVATSEAPSEDPAYHLNTSLDGN